MTEIAERSDPVILAYHHVCRNWYPTITRVIPRRFESQLQYLQQNGYNVGSLSHYFCFQGSEKSPSVLLTFDDAFSCIYENAVPRLLEYGMKATIFVITKYIGKTGQWDYYNRSGRCRHLTWQQLRELDQLGIEIGSHSHTHADMKSLPRRQLVQELKYSKKLIEDKLGSAVRFFSYPFGRFDCGCAELCRSAGYTGAVTMTPGSGFTNLYTLPRFAVYLFEDLRQFRLKLRTNPVSRFEHVKLSAINCFSMGTILLKNME